MTIYEEAGQVKSIVDSAAHIVIVQADNPDADSLCSALILEEILGDVGKTTSLFCGVDMPSYLSYLSGYDRISKDLPTQFDASIIVDTSSITLLGQLEKNNQLSWLAAKPSVVIDHHKTEATIKFASVVSNHVAVSTTEVIYELASQLNWHLNAEAKKLTAIGILSDSLGLTTESTTARSIHVIAELVEGGIKLAEIEDARRQSMKRDPELIHYKGRLLERVEFYDNSRIATVTIPWEEIEKYSPLYNPPMLVLDDMRLARDTGVAVAFKLYSDGKITAKIRCSYGYGVADKLAEHFGGGGHEYAAGFKIQDGRAYEDVKQECIAFAADLLDKLKQPNATI